MKQFSRLAISQVRLVITLPSATSATRRLSAVVDLGLPTDRAGLGIEGDQTPSGAAK